MDGLCLETLAERHSLSHQANDLAIGSTASTLVLVDHHFVKCIGNQFALLNDVFIATVARRRIDDQPTFVRHFVEGVTQCHDGGRVVTVVDDDRRISELNHVESRRNIQRIVDKRFQ